MDLTSDLLNTLQQNRWLDWISSECMLPAYSGQSILNIPDTVCSWFGIPSLHAGPLKPEITDPVSGNIKRIILILVDALALHQLQYSISSGKTPVWEKLAKSGLFAPLTSVVPSTTSAAITSLWTGHSPAEHGVIGYELWLKEYGIVTNMILQAPMSYHSGRSNLTQAGFNPETALSVPTLGKHLTNHGIQPFSFQPYAISKSGLSKTFMQNVSLQGYGSEAELWVNLRQLIESKKGQKLYTWVYTGTFDGLAHRFGPDDERAELEFINFSRSFEHNFLERLKPETREGTLLVLTADHGQVLTPKDDRGLLIHHPDLMNALHIKPSGEHRFTYLHVKPDKKQFVRDYFEATWPGQFFLFESNQLLESGLLGKGRPDRQTASRMGDLTVIARENHFLWWDEEENPLLGRHGGLTPREMLVPFLAVRL